MTREPTHTEPVPEKVILVDEFDCVTGEAEKQLAHQRGDLHRAFSVFAFNQEGALLLQRRSGCKYHSGGLWANTCCGHPRPGEHVDAAAQRRLTEEFGVTSLLTPVGHVRYRADVGGGLTENEFAHLYVGTYAGDPSPAISEISDHRHEDWPSMVADVRARPENYAPWLRIYLSRYYPLLTHAVATIVPNAVR